MNIHFSAVSVPHTRHLPALNRHLCQAPYGYCVERIRHGKSSIKWNKESRISCNRNYQFPDPKPLRIWLACKKDVISSRHQTPFKEKLTSTCFTNHGWSKSTPYALIEHHGPVITLSSGVFNGKASLLQYTGPSSTRFLLWEMGDYAQQHTDWQFGMVSDPPTGSAATNADRPRTMPPPGNVNFPFAGQPDIVRANQKDVMYQAVLREHFHSILRTYLGTRTHMKWQVEVSLAADFCYHALTTLAGTQTLGEEYCDIMQITQGSLTVPSPLRRTLLVLSHILLPYLAHQAATWLRIASRNLAPVDTMYTLLIRRAAEFVPSLRSVWSEYLRSVHLAWFYFTGSFYHVAKRIAGIRYIFTRQLENEEEVVGYEVIGALILTQLVIRYYSKSNEKIGQETASAALTDGDAIMEG
ncbi:hypothetical protein SeLEV6574_g00786 [Synchytrium endobioticum]|uniref:RING-type E3 ubiquitin transferase n=1 Tax=Synchytrium endobioticum TaxID=286115 RepID=A0A507DGA1_9FUNG|nr:hypothetical protein SeLEV6574_g00786 [Synchytrium endobioticum]